MSNPIPTRMILLIIAAISCLAAPLPSRGEPPAPDAAAFRILVFSKTRGFRHDSIPAGVQMMQRLAARHGFIADATEDSSRFTADNLVRYAVVVFLCTTGDVLEPAEEAAFEQYIRAGGGFVGIHSAADTEYTWAFYGQLVGAYFASHPDQQTALIRISDPRHPSTAGLPDPWVRFDEWYNFQQRPGPGVRVLARLDESSYSGGTMGADHPITWCHERLGGRAWYTGGGHTAASYSEPLFEQHVWGGIRWAAGTDAAPGPRAEVVESIRRE